MPTSQEVTRRPAKPNYRCSTGSGTIAEDKFYKMATDAGYYCMQDPKGNDNGIDCITMAVLEDGTQVHKNVQITIASLQGHTKSSYTVNKKISAIREEIDRGELLARRHAVLARRFHVSRHLPFQSSNTDHVEFVEVRRRNR